MGNPLIKVDDDRLTLGQFGNTVKCLTLGLLIKGALLCMWATLLIKVDDRRGYMHDKPSLACCRLDKEMIEIWSIAHTELSSK